MRPKVTEIPPYSPLQMAVNAGGQMIAWYACLAGAAQGHPGWAPVSLGVLLLLHAYLHERDIWPTTLKLLALGLLFGGIFDTLLISVGVYVPRRWLLPAPLPPLWFLVLWMNFAMCLHVAFRALQARPILAAALGALFGPSAYLGAARLGALALPEPRLWRLALLSLAWALGVWLLTRIALTLETGRIHSNIEPITMSGRIPKVSFERMRPESLPKHPIQNPIRTKGV